MKRSTGKTLLIGCLGGSFALLLLAGIAGWLVFSALKKVNNNIDGGYVVNDNKVTYYTGMQGSGAPRSWEIKEADISTFKFIGAGYAVDKNNAYLNGEIIPQSSGATFKIIQKPYAADQSHVFYDSGLLSNSPGKFKFITQDTGGILSTDGERVFYGSKVLFPETIDGATFERIGATDYFRDKNHVYTVKKIIEGADPATFEVMPEYKEIYAKDKNSVFYDGVKVEGCDVKTHRILNQTTHRDAGHVFFTVRKFSDDAKHFQLFASNYSADSQNVYWEASKISQDAAHFKAFPSADSTAYAKDDKNVYWCDKKLEQADASSFTGLNQHYGKDKNKVWFGVNENDLPEIVENADAATFEADETSYDGKDKNNTFTFGRVKNSPD